MVTMEKFAGAVAAKVKAKRGMAKKAFTLTEALIASGAPAMAGGAAARNNVNSMAKEASAAPSLSDLADALEKRSEDDGILASIARMAGAKGNYGPQGEALLRDTLISLTGGAGLSGIVGGIYGAVNPSDPDNMLASVLKPAAIAATGGGALASLIPILARKGILPDGMTDTLLSSGVLSSPGYTAPHAGGVQDGIRKAIEMSEGKVREAAGALSKLSADMSKEGVAMLIKAAADMDASQRAR
jgi:hypothetical protein